MPRQRDGNVALRKVRGNPTAFDMKAHDRIFSIACRMRACKIQNQIVEHKSSGLFMFHVIQRCAVFPLSDNNSECMSIPELPFMLKMALLIMPTMILSHLVSHLVPEYDGLRVRHPPAAEPSSSSTRPDTGHNRYSVANCAPTSS